MESSAVTRRLSQDTETILRRLVQGCKTHPAYRAKRAPRSACRACVQMYKDKQQLDKIDATYNLLQEISVRPSSWEPCE